MQAGKAAIITGWSPAVRRWYGPTRVLPNPHIASVKATPTPRTGRLFGERYFTQVAVTTVNSDNGFDL